MTGRQRARDRVKEQQHNEKGYQGMEHRLNFNQDKCIFQETACSLVCKSFLLFKIRKVYEKEGKDIYSRELRKVRTTGLGSTYPNFAFDI